MAFIPWPYRLLGALAVALALFLSGYQLGGKHASTACIAGQVQAQRAAVAAADQEDARRAAIGAVRETSREQIRVIYRTLREQGAAVVDVAASGVGGAGCGLDADGLRVWNAANAGTAAPLPSEPDGGLPHPAARKVGELGGFAGQPYRSDGAGSAVSGSIEQVGEVRE